MMKFAMSLAALAIPAAAQAVVFQSTYTPTTTNATTYKYTHLPLDYRTPTTAFSTANAGTSSGYCINTFCTYVQSDQTFTEFTGAGNYTATHILLPLISYHYQQRGIGIQLDHFNTASNQWENLAFAQLDTNYIPANQQLEVRIPFGNNSTYQYAHFGYTSANIVDGERYRIGTNGAFGGIGGLNWFASDLNAAPGTTYVYSKLIPSHQYVGTANLAKQMAWALTDGGDLALSAAPEPASWAMLIGGFGLAGFAARRKRATAFA